MAFTMLKGGAIMSLFSVIRKRGHWVINLLAFKSLFLAMFVLLVFGLWPVSSAHSSTDYELCDDINHINVNGPMAVAVDNAEQLYVVEAASNSVHIYDRSVLRLKSIKRLANPISVAVASEGNIYVGNSIIGKSNVAVYDSNLEFLFNLGSGEGEFEQPAAIAVSSTGKIYVVDRKQDAVNVYYPDGSFDFSFGSSGSADGQFNSPSSLAIHEESVVITDLPIITEADGAKHEGARLQIFSLTGDFVASYNKYGQGDGFLTKPLGVAINRSGSIWVADSFQNVVQVFDSLGTYQTTLFNPNQPMRTPLDISFDPVSQRLYVASLSADRVDLYCPILDSFFVTGLVDGNGGTLSAGEVTVEAESNSSFQVEELGNIVFSISADHLNGYYLKSVLVDGVDALASSQLDIVEENDQQRPVRAEYTFSNIAADHTIAVQFELNSYTLTADVTSSVADCGDISPSGSVISNHGDSQTFTTTFDPVQCDFLDLIVDDVSVGSHESWTFSDLSADHTILAVFGLSTLDSDGDGIPDYWEIAFDLDPNDPSDAGLDSDGDGGVNLAEFIGGTDPRVEDVGAVKNDFNGDGRSDILSRSVSFQKGTLLLNEMNGNIITESTIVKHLNHVWEIAHIGDFTGENKVDLLIRHSTAGTLFLFEMDGPSILSEERIGKFDKWDLVAAADFTGDGKEDLLLREKDTELLQMNMMDGHTISSEIDLGTLNSEYDVVGTGDFNGDGKFDILFRDNGKELLWLYEMDGSGIHNSSLVGNIAANLIVVGIADFSGDKKADILLRHADTGLLALYQMDGSAILSSDSIGELSLEWQVVEVADYSGDGKADILLQDMITGELRICEMDGSTILANNQVGDFNLSWQPQ